MAVKEYLIARATMRATGAEIHKLNNVLCMYRNYCSVLEFKSDKETEDMVDQLEEVLECYIVNGKLKMGGV